MIFSNDRFAKLQEGSCDLPIEASIDGTVDVI